ncbi:lysophospholipid acyltransferase 2 [Elysia marginata]|uniref:Lysophospholipid acyltransferase 2 n=1 Tax=Elysia marginata TaxID=1093978 RepID=A0AAV4JB18_9GAST|nr:lysophospholipid acyltransferase 2 [Elysia marginata]
MFLLGVMTLAKHKYYFAWILGDALNNAAGLGFSGYDSQGNPQFDLTDNVDVYGVEFSTSLKVNIDSWNKKTLIWLRRVVYDRAPTHNTLAVFACSAFWHGFYPAYYITFGSGAFMTIVARQVRRKIRPHFQTSPSLRFLYDVLTFTACRFANPYLAMPFLVLEFQACYLMYKSLYFYLHIMALVVLVVLMFVPTPRQGKPQASLAASRGSSAAQPVAMPSTQSSQQNAAPSLGTDGTELVKRAPHTNDSNETNGNLNGQQVLSNGSPGVKADTKGAGSTPVQGKSKLNGIEGGGGTREGLGTGPNWQPEVVADLHTKAE